MTQPLGHAQEVMAMPLCQVVDVRGGVDWSRVRRGFVRIIAEIVRGIHNDSQCNEIFDCTHVCNMSFHT